MEKFEAKKDIVGIELLTDDRGYISYREKYSNDTNGEWVNSGRENNNPVAAK